MSASSPTPGARRSVAGVTRVSSPVLAGRTDELEVLGAALARPPALALLEGEAGVGKTRLVTELVGLVRAEGRRVVVGRCHPLHAPFPLGPVVEAVRALGDDVGDMALSPLAGALRPVFPDLAHRLPPPPEPLGDRDMERHRLWRALVEVFAALGPALVVLEDLHWSDDATPEFLAFLASQQPPELALLVTARTDGRAGVPFLGEHAARLPASTSVVRLHLAPLLPPEVKVMVGAILETDHVSDEFAAYLHERTAGIPFAVEEVLRLLIDRKEIVRRRGQWARRALEQVEVPAAIRDSMLERVGRLSSEARALVEAAAVVGEAGSVALLGSAAGLDEDRAAAALNESVAAGMVLATDDGYGCRHAIAAQAVYDAIAPLERQLLHHRVAKSLEAERDAVRGGGPHVAARLAHHWREAGEEARWVRFAEEAAALASALGDAGTATRLLLDAIGAVGIDSSTRVRLAVALSEAALDSLGQAEAIEAIQGVLGTHELPPLLRGLLRGGLGALLHQAGDASGAHAEFAAAVPDLGDEPFVRARLMFALALPWVLEGGLDEHLHWLVRADELADSLEDDSARSLLRGERATILLAVGDGAGWAAIPPPPPPPPGARSYFLDDRARLCTNLAINAFYLGHDDRAAAFAQEGLRLSAATSYGRMAPALRTASLLLDWAGGRWEGLEASAQDMSTQQPDVPSLVQATTVIAQLALAHGRIEDAGRLCTETLRSAGRCGALATLGTAAATLARLRLAEGDTDAARTQVVGPLEVLERKGIWVWASGLLPTAVEALVGCGAVAEADAWCRRFAAGVRGRDAPWARAALAASRAKRGVPTTLVPEEERWPST